MPRASETDAPTTAERERLRTNAEAWGTWRPYVSVHTRAARIHGTLRTELGFSSPMPDAAPCFVGDADRPGCNRGDSLRLSG